MELGLESFNITIVFETLNLQAISRDRVRSLFSAEPIVADFPQVLLFVFPGLNIQCVAEDRRLRFNSQATGSEAKENLVHLARSVWETVTDETIAYGFNYAVSGHLEEGTNVLNLLKQQLLRSPERLEERLAATSLIFSPKLIYESDDLRYELTIEPNPAANNEFRSRFNAHHVASELAEENILLQELDSHYEKFRDSLQQVLEV